MNLLSLTLPSMAAWQAWWRSGATRFNGGSGAGSWAAIVIAIAIATTAIAAVGDGLVEGSYSTILDVAAG